MVNSTIVDAALRGGANTMSFMVGRFDTDANCRFSSGISSSHDSRNTRPDVVPASGDG